MFLCHMRGRRLVELTDGCYSGGDSQGSPLFIHPRVLGTPIMSFQKLYSQIFLNNIFFHKCFEIYFYFEQKTKFWYKVDLLLQTIQAYSQA